MTHKTSFITPDDPPSPQHTGKMMRFKLYWRHKGEKQEVAERHERETNDPEKWSREIIDWFNSRLRPHERKRIFVRCEIEGEVPPAEHKWFKITAMTKSMVGSQRHGQMYDAMQCERCGVTGKRYGLGPYVKLDSKYRKKHFKRCDTTIAASQEIKS